ncbi:hypothetical protein B0T10DRAFT_546050 [Thelonectria olida]|uniref:Uncharacterized protein n=1 Tax=Thelonectria olida TaxID=1576542 RepID=A0A9P9AQ93_9HYPO|nr:hypothetical protein B0T10DRAFT_546050 [Thelonectria olida]
MSDHNNTTADLGLSCPQGGHFWVCANKETRFIGCCLTNPCETYSGVCLTGDLKPAAFDAGAVGQIPDQACVSDSFQVKWYACNDTSPPFLGCCAKDACSAGTCDGQSLRAARLSGDAELFLSHGNVSVVLPSASELSTKTITASSTSVATGSASDHKQRALGLSRDGNIALIGALIGALGVIGLALACFCTWRCTGFCIWRCIKRLREKKRPARASQGLEDGFYSTDNESDTTSERSTAVHSSQTTEETAEEMPRPSNSVPNDTDLGPAIQLTEQASTGRRVKRQRDLGPVSSFTGPFEDEWGYPERE